jgi:hypothetical protein
VVGCGRTNRPKKVNLLKIEVSPMLVGRKRELIKFEGYDFLKKENDTSFKNHSLLKFQTISSYASDFNFRIVSRITI